MDLVGCRGSGCARCGELRLHRRKRASRQRERCRTTSELRVAPVKISARARPGSSRAVRAAASSEKGHDQQERGVDRDNSDDVIEPALELGDLAANHNEQGGGHQGNHRRRHPAGDRLARALACARASVTPANASGSTIRIPNASRKGPTSTMSASSGPTNSHSRSG